MSNTRNGQSIVTDINHLPKKTLTSSLGFTEEQADKMMKVRRVLPLVDDRQEPCIDARKLWERIGKPEGRFDMWVARGASSILHRFVQNEEVSTQQTKTGKRPRTDYTLSRDCAAHLAMMAGTPKGHDIRQYFLDMEEAIIRLERYRPIRTEHLTEIDNSVYHYAVSETGSKMYAQEIERFLKGMVCEVISGMSASEWRETLNDVPGAKGKSIRDVLDGDDLKTYRDAFKAAAFLFEVGITDRDEIKSKVRQKYAGTVDPAKYLGDIQQSSLNDAQEAA